MTVLESIFNCDNIKSKEIMAVIEYGSRVSGGYTDTSDIDVLVISNTNEEGIGGFMLNDMMVEYHVFPLDAFINLSAEEIMLDSDRSLYSILTSGKVIYGNDYATFFIEEIKNQLLSYSYSRRLPRNSSSYRNLVLEWLHAYHSSFLDNNYRLFIYNNLIEFIRRFDSDDKGFDVIPTFKFFKIMGDKLIRDSYGITNFPKEEYMKSITAAIKDEDINTPFFNRFLLEDLDSFNDLYSNCSHNYIRHKMVIINNAFERVKGSWGKYYYRFYYSVLLEKIRVLYMQIKGKSTSIIDFNIGLEEPFDILFRECIDKVDIQSLDNIFKLIQDIYEQDSKKPRIYFEKYYINFKK